MEEKADDFATAEEAFKEAGADDRTALEVVDFEVVTDPPVPLLPAPSLLGAKQSDPEIPEPDVNPFPIDLPAYSPP